MTEKKVRKRGIGILIFSIVSVWIIHGWLIIKVSDLEKLAKIEKKKLAEVQKEVSEKRIAYEQRVDLGKIEKEMRTKHKMEISKDIQFFKIKS